MGDIEVTICIIKKHFCVILDGLPYKQLPAWMIVELVMFCIMQFHAFPPKSGVSAEYSPQMIMTGMKLDFSK